ARLQGRLRRRHNLPTMQAMLRHFGNKDRARDIYRSGCREPEENLRRDRQTRAQSPPKEWR
ncbi:MAG: hypothetical protein RR101_09250, partial [Burkholderiaceae bacterium]